MSTTERKARKRAGVKFERIPKVGTPLTERASFNVSHVWDPVLGRMRPASVSKRQRALEARGVVTEQVRRSRWMSTRRGA